MRRSPTCCPAKPYYARGMCGACYMRAKADGTLVDRRPIYLPRRDFLPDYRILRGQGHSPLQIAERLRISRSGVYKARARARAAGEL